MNDAFQNATRWFMNLHNILIQKYSMYTGIQYSNIWIKKSVSMETIDTFLLTKISNIELIIDLWMKIFKKYNKKELKPLNSTITSIREVEKKIIWRLRGSCKWSSLFYPLPRKVVRSLKSSQNCIKFKLKSANLFHSFKLVCNFRIRPGKYFLL